MHRTTVGMCEHEVIVVPRAVAHLLFELQPSPRPQHGNSARVEVDRSPACRCLRRTDLGFVADGQQLLINDEAGRIEVDAAPGESEQLAASHAGVRRQVDRRRPIGVLDSREEAAQLLGRPHLMVLRPVENLRRVGEVGDVAQHGALAMRVGERLAEHPVDVPNRLRYEPAAGAVALAVDEQLGVQRVEVLGLELSELDRSDPRCDVEPDVVPVRLVRRPTQLRLLERQPPIVEVVGEGRLALVSAGRPIDTAVHDDEVAVPLLGDEPSC